MWEIVSRGLRERSCRVDKQDLRQKTANSLTDAFAPFEPAHTPRDHDEGYSYTPGGLVASKYYYISLAGQSAQGGSLY
jgi:hypothetical protein